MNQDSKLGWKATAGSKDESELISLFNRALMDEIDHLKKVKGEKLFMLTMEKKFTLPKTSMCIDLKQKSL